MASVRLQGSTRRPRPKLSQPNVAINSTQTQAAVSIVSRLARACSVGPCSSFPMIHLSSRPHLHHLLDSDPPVPVVFLPLYLHIFHPFIHTSILSHLYNPEKAPPLLPPLPPSSVVNCLSSSVFLSFLFLFLDVLSLLPRRQAPPAALFLPC